MRDALLNRTPQALGYGLLGVVLLGLGAWQSSSRVVLLGGLLLALVLVEAIWLRASKPEVQIEVQPRRTQEGGAVSVRLDAHRVRRNHQLHVTLSPALQLRDGTNLWNPDRREEAHRFSLDAIVRGPQNVGPTLVRSWSPARVWATDASVLPAVQVEVIPRVENVEEVGLLSRVVKPMQGRFTASRPGQGFDFFTLRQYHSGDTMRAVNWKASAKRDDDLIVNQRQLETHTEMAILLDARIVSGVGSIGTTPLDRGCRLALGLYADALSNRDTVHFMTYGDGVGEIARDGQERVHAAESFLARIHPRGSTQLDAAWRQARIKFKSRGPIIVITSAEADGTVPSVVADMLGRGHPVTLVSPRPDFPEGLAANARQALREENLEATRDRGAVVVDWPSGSFVHSERPSVGVLA